MTNYYAVLLFDAATFNPLFTALGLLLGAAGIGLAYGAVKLMKRTNASENSGSRVVGVVSGLVLLGGAAFVLGLAVLCAMW
jgi:hypothetical protein